MCVWLLLCGYDGSADLRAAIPSQDTIKQYPLVFQVFILSIRNESTNNKQL